MKELKDYYDSWKKKAWILSLICWVILVAVFYSIDVLISNVLTIWANDPNVLWIDSKNIDFIKYIITLLLGFITPTSVTVFIYFQILNYINKKGWKKKFPHYDVSGTWTDITTYTKRLGKDGWEVLLDKSISSPAIIEQTCQHILIKNSVGEDFRWYSILADWNENGALEIFYKVEYSNKLQLQGYPECRVGYERMNIQNDGQTNNQRPTVMRGQFWHCLASDEKPVYMGDVVYKK